MMRSWYKTDGTEKLESSLKLCLQDISEELKEFTRVLYSLKNVPVSYLLCDEGMVPEETIRFFYIDENWTEALVDGALSVGRSSSFDVKHDAAVRTEILQSVREKAEGRSVRTGFFLRSKLVSGWPGLNILCYGDEAGETEPLPCEAISRLGPDLLLCIAEGVIRRVEFVEPSESMAFGFTVDEEGNLSLPVYALPLVGENDVLRVFSQKGKSIFLPVPFRKGGTEGVVDIGELSAQISAALEMEPETISALEMAAELLDTPVKYSVRGGLL